MLSQNLSTLLLPFLRRWRRTILLTLLVLPFAITWIVHVVSNRVLHEETLHPFPAYPTVTGVLPSGRREVFVLDTGANANLVDVSLQDELGAELFSTSVRGPNGDMEMAFYYPPKIMLGSWTVPPVQTALMKDNPMKIMMGQPLHGLLGVPTLRGKVLILDYDAGRLQIARGFSGDESGMTRLKMRYDELLPVLDLTLGSGNAVFMVDTGATAVVNLDRETYQRCLKEGLVKSEGKALAGSISGIVSMPAGTFLGGSLLGQPLKGSRFACRESRNIIGMSLLARLYVVMDFKRDLFLFRRREYDHLGAPLLNVPLMLGLALQYRGGACMVEMVMPDSPAERAGIKDGDEIFRLGEVSREELNVSSIYAAVAGLEDQEPLRVEVLSKQSKARKTVELVIRKRVCEFGE
jgi:predicted aspartyl protease